MAIIHRNRVVKTSHDFWKDKQLQPQGGTDLERGYGDVQPWRPPFPASPVVYKGPISNIQVSVHKTPFWENLEILAFTALIFAQILALKPPNFEIFSSQAPKFGNF